MQLEVTGSSYQGYSLAKYNEQYLCNLENDPENFIVTVESMHVYLVRTTKFLLWNFYAILNWIKLLQLILQKLLV